MSLAAALLELQDLRQRLRCRAEEAGRVRRAAVLS